jgi:hypothetical protein
MHQEERDRCLEVLCGCSPEAPVAPIGPAAQVCGGSETTFPPGSLFIFFYLSRGRMSCLAAQKMTLCLLGQGAWSRFG